jgi:hypothetical protein
METLLVFIVALLHKSIVTSASIVMRTLVSIVIRPFTLLWNPSMSRYFENFFQNFQKKIVHIFHIFKIFGHIYSFWGTFSIFENFWKLKKYWKMFNFLGHVFKCSKFSKFFWHILKIFSTGSLIQHKLRSESQYTTVNYNRYFLKNSTTRTTFSDYR